MSIQKNIIRLLTQSANSDDNYYWLSVFVGSDEAIHWSVQTEWCGYTEDRPRREIREASVFDPESQREAMHKLGIPILIINEIGDLPYFLGFGGHALVCEKVAREKFPHLIEPRVVAADSSGLGYRRISQLSEAELQHAPSKKLRMKVINRDGRRCLICGRSPMHYVDVELHVHHAIPWGQGGITEEANLITLCKTCHDGLDPHKDPTLTEYLAKQYPTPEVRHFDDIEKYQKWIKDHIDSTSTKNVRHRNDQ